MRRMGAAVIVLAGLGILGGAFLTYSTSRLTNPPDVASVRGIETLPGIVAVVVGIGLIVAALLGGRSDEMRRALGAIALIASAYLTFNGLVLVYNFEQDELKAATAAQAEELGIPASEARGLLEEAGVSIELGPGVLVVLGGGIVGLLGSVVWLSARGRKEDPVEEPAPPPPGDVGPGEDGTLP